MDAKLQLNLDSDLLNHAIASSVTGFLLVERNGRILEANDSYCQLLGYDRDEVISRNISDFSPADNINSMSERSDEIIESGSLRFEDKHQHKDGTVIELEAVFNYSPEHGGLFFSFFRDVSEQKRTVKILAARVRLMEYSQNHSIGELLRKTLDEAETLTDSCIGFYHFLNDDQQMLTLQAWSTRTTNQFCKVEGADVHYHISQAGVWADCVRERRTIIHNDYAALSRRKGMPLGHTSVIRELVVPVFRNQKIVAIVGVGNKHADYNQHDVEMITCLADLAWDVAKHKLADEALQQSERQVQATLDGLSAHIALLDDQGNILLVNKAWCDFARKNSVAPDAAMPGSNYLQVCATSSANHEADAEIFAEGIRSVLAEEKENFSMEYPCHSADEQRWFIGKVTPFQGDGPRRVIIAHENITERKLAEIALRESEERFRTILENAPIGKAVVSLEGRFLMANRSLCKILGYQKEELEKLTFQELTHPDDLPSNLAYVQQMLAGDFSSYNMEKRYIRKDRQTVWTQLASSVVRDAGGVPLYLIAQIEDITIRKQAEKALEELNRRLEALSVTDGLTGIANRRRFDEFLAQEHARHARSGATLSLILLDIDHFKLFNDHYGHIGGDDCLKQIAQVLDKSTIRPADVAARYGGEEFACILPETSQRGALRVAERIRQGIMDLAIPHEWSDAAACVSASFGVVTTHCSTGGKVTDIIAQADALLYKAKSLGRNRVEYNEMPPDRGGINLVQLVWQESFCSGNKLIDLQHKALFSCTNELLKAVLESSPKKVISSLIAKLLDEISKHFCDEEKILETVGFPGVKQHSQEHAKLYQEGLELLRQFDSEILHFGTVFEFLVYEVVNQHMISTDREYFSYTITHNRGHHA